MRGAVSSAPAACEPAEAVPAPQRGSGQPANAAADEPADAAPQRGATPVLVSRGEAMELSGGEALAEVATDEPAEAAAPAPQLGSSEPTEVAADEPADAARQRSASPELVTYEMMESLEEPAIEAALTTEPRQPPAVRECTLCGCGFATAADLHGHLRSDHPHRGHDERNTGRVGARLLRRAAAALGGMLPTATPLQRGTRLACAQVLQRAVAVIQRRAQRDERSEAAERKAAKKEKKGRQRSEGSERQRSERQRRRSGRREGSNDRRH